MYSRGKKQVPAIYSVEGRKRAILRGFEVKDGFHVNAIQVIGRRMELATLMECHFIRTYRYVAARKSNNDLPLRAY